MIRYQHRCLRDEAEEEEQKKRSGDDLRTERRESQSEKRNATLRQP